MQTFAILFKHNETNQLVLTIAYADNPEVAVDSAKKELEKGGLNPSEFSVLLMSSVPLPAMEVMGGPSRGLEKKENQKKLNEMEFINVKLDLMRVIIETNSRAIFRSFIKIFNESEIRYLNSKLSGT